MIELVSVDEDFVCEGCGAGVGELASLGPYGVVKMWWLCKECD